MKTAIAAAAPKIYRNNDVVTVGGGVTATAPALRPTLTRKEYDFSASRKNPYAARLKKSEAA